MNNGQDIPKRGAPRSHGTGEFKRSQFRHVGDGVVFESGVLVFHPENIEIGDNVYVGHNAILKSYYRGKMVIGRGTWIGQQCFFHSAGDIFIGEDVGIGPGVKIITSAHAEDGVSKPILHAAVEMGAVIVGDGADIGIGAILLPAVTVGKGARIGAGAVVNRDVPDYAVAAGVPARVLRMRPGAETHAPDPAAGE